MYSLTRIRPTNATIVAAIALTVALAGSTLAGADAASKPLSKAKVGKIANKRANAVLDKREGTLNVNSAKTAATATSAESAQNAQNAQNAASVNGVGLAEIDYSAAPVAGKTTVFQGSGLTLQAECAAGVEIAITATTEKSDSSIYTSSVTTDFDTDNTLTDDEESGAFDPGDNFNILIDGSADSGITTFEYYAPDGSSVSGTIGTDEVQVGGSPAACEAHGHVLAS